MLVLVRLKRLLLFINTRPLRSKTSLLEVEHSYKFIVFSLLGEIYNDVEQINDSVKSYQAALEEIIKLPSAEASKYYQYILFVYNNLGLSYLNRD